MMQNPTTVEEVEAGLKQLTTPKMSPACEHIKDGILEVLKFLWKVRSAKKGSQFSKKKFYSFLSSQRGSEKKEKYLFLIHILIQNVVLVFAQMLLAHGNGMNVQIHACPFFQN